MMRRRWAGSAKVRGSALGAAVAVQVLAAAVAAHPLAPTLLQLTERDGGLVEVLRKTSILRVPGSDVQPVLPPGCRRTGQGDREESGSSVLRRWTADCGRSDLVGASVGFSGLGPAKIDGLVRVTLADGRTVRGVVRRDAPLLEIPEAASAFGVFRDYLRLGFAHILSGLDHLLFVFGLLLLVRSAALLIKTISAFTAGHSVTLSLAALGLVRYPSAWIEVIIALSVFVLAVELTRERGPHLWMMRRPWLVAGMFGLLHGLGFAGALSEIGLPQNEIPMALLSFNFGIELGQLAFVAVVLALWRVGRPGLRRLPVWVERVPLYAMGSLAAFWVLDRLAGALSV